MKLAASFAFIFAISGPALAESSACRPLTEVHSQVVSAGDKWIELSKEQWYFIAGNYTLNPGTPQGLPYGDKAVLVTPEKDPTVGMILFIDGDLACTPLRVPPILMSMLHDVGVKINHEGLAQ